MNPQMDPATQRQWETWANALIQKKLEGFAEIIGAEVGQIEKRLNERIAALEAEVAILRTAKNVTPFRGNRDVA
jgi:hypothetical protein